jgi:hypothetical protein
MATALYKKIKPFLAMRYMVEKPDISGDPVLFWRWIQAQLMSNFDPNSRYKMPSKIDKRALRVFNSIELSLRHAINVAAVLGKKYDDDKTPPTRVVVSKITAGGTIILGPIPVPPVPGPGPGHPADQQGQLFVALRTIEGPA